MRIVDLEQEQKKIAECCFNAPVYGNGLCMYHYYKERELSKKKKNKKVISSSDVNREHLYKTYYGITIADYDKMLESQGGSCAICGKTPEENGRRLAIDHSHKTEKIRGLLCSNCNMLLGYSKDNPDTLRRAAAYLEP